MALQTDPAEPFPSTPAPLTPPEADDDAIKSRWSRWSRPLAALATALVFAAVAFAIYKLTAEVSYAEVVSGLSATSYTSLVLAFVFTALSFATLCLYDFNALTSIGRKLPTSEVVLTAFSAYAVGNVAGFGALSGGAIRYRSYSRAGLTPDEIARVIAFVTLAFTLGLTVVVSLSLLVTSSEIAPLLGMKPWLLQAGAVAVLVALVAMVVIGRNRSLTIAGFTIRIAETRILSRQLIITAADLALAASVLYALLPADAAISWPAFFAAFCAAIGLGILSHVPAGLGVFETVIVAALGGQVGTEAVLAALVAYRVIYYVVPLVVAILAVTVAEIRRLGDHPLASGVARTAFRIAPLLLSTLSLVLGVMLIVSSVTPTPSQNLETLASLLPLPIVEGAHFIASLLGLVLVVGARGLSQRLDGAWWLVLIAASVGILLSLLKAVALIEAGLLGLLIIALISSRSLFIRPASLFRQALTAAWLMAIAVLCIGAVVVLLFVYRDVQYSHDLWWQFEFEAEAPRSLRAALGLVVLSSCLSLFSLLRPAALPVSRAEDHAVERAVEILAHQDEADANLVRTGDKAVMFSAGQDGFVMYGKHGRSLIAFLDPIGTESARTELVWQFVEAARAGGCRAVFYQISPALLPAIADAGLQAFKLGETAIVDLKTFDLKGGKWANLRQTAARAERDGLSFEIIEESAIPAILPELRQVSDGWLAHHDAREKGFSLGAFTDAYMLSQPVAILRFEGRIVAFANLLLTQTRQEASIDLMRFSPDAPKGAMDFLFVSLLTRLREEGHATFNLGMAPLSGLSRRDAAPVWDRIANTFFEHGERFYNFKGLRAFKSKFHPEWQPRYLAVSGGLSPVLALVDATLLIGGGLKGVVRK